MVRRLDAPPVLEAVAASYIEWYAPRRAEQSTATRRSQLARVLKQDAADGAPLGLVRVNAVTIADIETAVIEVSAHPTTREAARAALRAMLRWSGAREEDEAEKAGRRARWTKKNAASKAESHRVSGRVQVASPRQVARLLAAAEPYQAGYLRAFLHLGLRLAELIHSRLHDDLDVGTWTWRIQPRGPDPRCRCAQCQGTGWAPKNERSERAFLVPCVGGEDGEVLREAIERYLALYPAEDGDFAFRNPRTGELWHSRSLADDVKRLCTRAGVRYGRDVPGGLTAHTFRHTCATGLVRAGVRESVIAELLGDTVQTITETYVHLAPEDVADGVSRGPTYG